MNSVLASTNEDIMAEIKEMIKNVENIKFGIDMFGEMVKNKVSSESV